MPAYGLEPDSLFAPPGDSQVAASTDGIRLGITLAGATV
jgi:hypothetical protein